MKENEDIKHEYRVSISLPRKTGRTSRTISEPPLCGIEEYGPGLKPPSSTMTGKRIAQIRRVFPFFPFPAGANLELKKKLSRLRETT
jgi:hypothetical protein